VIITLTAKPYTAEHRDRILIEEARFVPQTAFGRELLALRKKAVQELCAHHEPLLDIEGIRQEVRERCGEREDGVDH
jgi:hypothetical protein